MADLDELIATIPRGERNECLICGALWWDCLCRPDRPQHPSSRRHAENVSRERSARGALRMEGDVLEMLRSQRCKRGPSGEWRCSCGAALAADAWICDPCLARSIEEGRQREIADRIKSAINAIHRARSESLRGGAERGEEPITNPPNWPWARFGNPEFRRRIHPALLAFENYKTTLGSGLLSFPTGAGKTAVLVAWWEQELARAIESANATEGTEWTLTDFRFVSGFEVAVARRNTPLGSEARIIREAMDCGLLFFDELGFEPRCDAIFYIIDHRYRSGRPTVVTTGLTVEEFTARYGDALFRRLTEGGLLLESGGAGGR